MVRMMSVGPQLIVNGKPVERATFEISREMIETTALPGNEPDHAWFNIDPAGHYHAFNKEGELPTLDARYADVRTFGDYETEDVFIGWFCAICGAFVEPKYKPTRPDGFATYTGGRVEWGGEFWSTGTGSRFMHGQRVSIRIPEMRRFGIAEIIEYEYEGNAYGEMTRIRYKYIGIGELAERKA